LDRVSNNGTAAMTVSSFAFANVTSSGTARASLARSLRPRVGDRR
jgi:hypothetical protein